MHKALAALMLLSVATAAIAQDDDFTDLTDSSLTITSKNWTDPLPGEKKDRVGLSLGGAAAKRIYDAMPVKARPDACEDGMYQKVAGNLVCSKASDGTYICMIAIMLANGQSKPFGEC